jgi:tetratricopeptide (TPR) repeat protein
MQHDVFLSYSRRDSDTMRSVQDILSDNDLTVWTDEGIETGTRSWKRSIENAILNTKCLVCLLSPDANESEWVRAEIDFAELHEKPIYLVLVRGEERQSIPFGFATMQWVDIRDKRLLAERVIDFASTLRERLRHTMQVKEVDTAQPTLAELIRDANLAYYDEDYDVAIQLYTKALSIDDNNKFLHLNRGTSYLAVNQFDLASIDLQHAIQLDDQDYMAFRRLGAAYSAMNNTTEAIKVFTKSIALQPSPKSYFERGNLYFDKRDFERALEDYTLIIESDVDHDYEDVSYSNRGECHFVLGDYTSALSDFEKASELTSDNQFSEAGRSVTLFVLGKQEEATTIWKRLLQVDKSFANPEYVGDRFDWPVELRNEVAKFLAE